MPEPKLYSLVEVAGILAVTRRTLYNYIKADKLKAVKIGKLWRVKEAELTRLTSQGTAQTNKL